MFENIGQLKILVAPLQNVLHCITFVKNGDMMKNLISVRLDQEDNELLASISKKTGRKKSDIIRDAVKRQLELLQFEELRTTLIPYAEKQGILTDDDVLKIVS